MVNGISNNKNNQRLKFIIYLNNYINNRFSDNIIKNSLPVFTLYEIFEYLKGYGEFYKINDLYNYVKKSKSIFHFRKYIGFKRVLLVTMLDKLPYLGKIYLFIYNSTRNILR